MCQNHRPLLISKKIQLPLGLLIRLYLFLYPWSSEAAEAGEAGAGRGGGCTSLRISLKHRAFLISVLLRVESLFRLLLQGFIKQSLLRLSLSQAQMIEHYHIIVLYVPYFLIQFLTLNSFLSQVLACLVQKHMIAFSDCLSMKSEGEN